MQYHIPEQNPQLCYCEASKFMKKCVLREPGSLSPSPHEPNMIFYTGGLSTKLCMHL